MLNDNIIAILARTHPQLWEIVGGGPGGQRYGAELVSLNPQPLPPLPTEAQRVAQEAFRLGVERGRQHVLALELSQMLNSSFDPDGPLCGIPREILIRYVPVPEPGPRPEWRWAQLEKQIAAGWAFAVSALRDRWSSLDGAGALIRALEVADEVIGTEGDQGAFAS